MFPTVLTEANKNRQLVMDAIDLYNRARYEVNVNGQLSPELATKILDSCDGKICDSMGGVMDSVNLPPGVLQIIKPVVEELFPDTPLVNWIPVDPESIKGYQTMAYPVYTAYANFKPAQLGTNSRRWIGDQFSWVDSKIFLDKTGYQINQDEETAIAAAMRNSQVFNAFNMIRLKEKALMKADAQQREMILAGLYTAMGLKGFANHDNILRIPLSEGFPSSDSNQNIQTLTMLLTVMERQSNGVFASPGNGTYSATTLMLPTRDHTTLMNQPRGTSTSDKTTLKFFVDNQPPIILDNGTQAKFETVGVPSFEGILGENKHLGVLLVRRFDCIRQCLSSEDRVAPSGFSEGMQFPVNYYRSELQAIQPYSIVAFEYSRN